MNSEMQALVRELSPRMEHALLEHLPVTDSTGAKVLNQAVHHSVFGGGKRMRPLLALVASRMVCMESSHALRIAAALEYLHTASLILDDLPCMDDTPERRGRPSTHMKFGEGVAVLAAMALLNQTYALLAELPNGAELVRLACECIGHRGMVSGQTIDLVMGAGARADRRQEHYLKTTALFRLALLTPAVAAGAAQTQRDALAEFGLCAGMGYQLVDDAHDLEDDRAWEGLPATELHARAGGWVEKAKSHLVAGFRDSRERRFLLGFADWLVAGAQASVAS